MKILRILAIVFAVGGCNFSDTLAEEELVKNSARRFALAINQWRNEAEAVGAPIWNDLSSREFVDLLVELQFITASEIEPLLARNLQVLTFSGEETKETIYVATIEAQAADRRWTIDSMGAVHRLAEEGMREITFRTRDIDRAR